MRSIFRNIMGYLGISREAEGPTASSGATRAGEIRDERPGSGTLTPEAENTRRLREIVDRSMKLGRRIAAQAQAGQLEAAADTARRAEDREERELALAGIERHKGDRRP